MDRHCARRDELIAEVQGHLIRLAELARQEVELVAEGSNNAWRAVDKEIENVIGEKERSLGALVEHRKEHGC